MWNWIVVSLELKRFKTVRVCEWTFVQTNVPIDQSVIQQSGDYKISRVSSATEFSFLPCCSGDFSSTRYTPRDSFAYRAIVSSPSPPVVLRAVSRVPKCGHFSRACIFIKLKRSPRKWLEHSQPCARALRLKAHRVAVYSLAASSDRGWCTTFHDTAWEIINR